MKYNDEAQAKFCKDIAEHFQTNIVTTRQVSEYVKSFNLPYPYFLTNDAKYKAGWGKYKVGEIVSNDASKVENSTQVEEAVMAVLGKDFVPDADKTYVPFGFYNDLRSIIEKRLFYTVYITGLSGNGKTMMVEQCCAELGREFIRVNITRDTDESDLIGSYELIDGNTVRREGPVLVAMRRGAILLLDETDYGSERLLCLQPILEGKGYYDKKTGEFIKPTQGFNVMATANTKGKGSDDGRFIGANILNEAFLERFAITIEQEYPAAHTESKILKKVFKELKIVDDDFITKLVNWAELIRKSYLDGSVEEIISTRRLVHVSKAYAIFKNRRKAIELCLNRFDGDTKKEFMDFYTKIDPNVDSKMGSIDLDVKTRESVAEAIERVNKDTLASVAVAAAAPAPAPVSQTQALNNLLKKFPPKNANNRPLPVPNTSKMNAGDTQDLVVFGDAKNIADVSAKYGVDVTVLRDSKDQSAVIQSHGFVTKVEIQNIMNAKDDLLDRIVSQHQDSKYKHENSRSYM